MDYGTDHKEDERNAWVFTSPKKTSRTYRYPLHRRNGYWVLSRTRDWYTQHALEYAEREFDSDVLRRHLAASQSSLDDFQQNKEKSESVSVSACNSD